MTTLPAANGCGASMNPRVRPVLSAFGPFIALMLGCAQHAPVEMNSSANMSPQEAFLVEATFVDAVDGSGRQYSAKLFRDGTAEYEGFKNVKLIGKVRYNLPASTVDAIVQRLRRARVEEMGPDSPLLTMTRAIGVLRVNLDGKNKNLQVSRDRLELMELFRDVHSLLNTEQFRCPYEIKDYGPSVGSVDRCRAEEVFLDLAIGTAKKTRERR